jgi:hypothetical protein
MSNQKGEPEASTVEGQADVSRQPLPSSRRRGMLVRMAKTLAKLVALLKPKRRWSQFSLATMFIVVTVLCVGLAAINRANRQREAVAAIKAVGGLVKYDIERPGYVDAYYKQFLRRWLPRDYTDEVEFVSLREADDSDLGRLRPFARLRQLRLIQAYQVTNTGLRQLQDLTCLQFLELDCTQVTDSGLGHLHGLNLLEALLVGGTHATDSGVAELQKALPKCNIVR